MRAISEGLRVELIFRRAGRHVMIGGPVQGALALDYKEIMMGESARFETGLPACLRAELNCCDD